METRITTDPGFGLRLFEGLEPGLDLRDEAQLEGLLALADRLRGRAHSMVALSDLECVLAAEPAAWPLAARIAVKLARSKALLRSQSGPVHLSVVTAMYKEHHRIQSPTEHPHGEAFLDRKLRQLDWLFGGSPGHSWDLTLVDDGCPEGSGTIAEKILAERHPGAPARVAFLADAIARRVPAVAPLETTDQSRKGGSILYGMWLATRRSREGHVVLYTDADLSTHLGQAGLLIDPIHHGRCRLAAGSRRASSSVVLKGGARSSRGRLFIYLWKRLLPEIAYVGDTQCGFKAMSAPLADRLASGTDERGFAFDLELLLRTEHLASRSILPVPIAWIDSEAASTTVELQPYLPMLRSVVRLYRSQSESSAAAEPFARAIEALDERTWERAVDVLGPRVEAIDPLLDCALTTVAPEEIQGLAA